MLFRSKSAIASRLVSHTFESSYRPTGDAQQLFWRHHEEGTGRDILTEIEDLPGVELGTSGAALSVDGASDARNSTGYTRLLLWSRTRRRGRARRLRGACRDAAFIPGQTDVHTLNTPLHRRLAC